MLMTSAIYKQRCLLHQQLDIQSWKLVVPPVSVRVREQMDQWELNKNQKKNKKDRVRTTGTKTRVTLPYVKGVSEALI